ncbi:MAG: MaoC/PaaZ C-terminal domain-containing protein [Caulobacteraceae bacterium]
MPIAYPDVLDLKTDEQRFAWDDQKAMLYALGIGLGADPLDERELKFVYENGLKAMPTLVTVIAFGLGPLARAGVNFARVVHGEQAIELHAPLPPEGEAVGSTRVAAVYDKGADKGAILILETVLNTPAGDPWPPLRASIFARGDGGFGGPSEGEPPPHQVPGRPADQSIDIPTRPDQALLYRLSGDRNPLHADPNFARAVGFPRPILHGLCTYGIACRAVMQAYTDMEPAPVRSHQARFSAPVFPGETITVDLWRDGEVVSYEARVKAREATVIRNGRTVLG